MRDETRKVATALFQYLEARTAFELWKKEQEKKPATVITVEHRRAHEATCQMRLVDFGEALDVAFPTTDKAA